jgi:hypothetical protein
MTKQNQHIHTQLSSAYAYSVLATVCGLHVPRRPHCFTLQRCQRSVHAPIRRRIQSTRLVQLRDVVLHVGNRLTIKLSFTGEAKRETQQLLEVFVCRA